MKKVQRWFSLFLAAALLLCAAGCGTPAPSSGSAPVPGSAPAPGGSSQSEAVTRTQQFIKLAGGPSASTGYIAITSISNVVNALYPEYVFAPDISTGSAENVRMMLSGALDMGTVMADVSASAYNGEREFDETTKGSINFVMGGFVSLFNMFVPEDSAVNSIADLKGKRCGVSNGTMAQYYWPMLLEAYGMTADDVITVPLALGDICTGVSDGTLDFGVHVTPAPSTPISDLAVTKGIKLLSFEPEIIQAITSEYTYFQEEKIDDNVYPDTPGCTTLGTQNTLCCRPELDEQFVYDLVGAVLDARAELEAVHPAAGAFNIDNCLKGQTIPIHPGAERYYREHGLIK